MKNINFKTLWVFTFSILLFSLLASCWKNADSNVWVNFDNNSAVLEKNMEDISEPIIEEEKIMDKEVWTDWTKDEMMKDSKSWVYSEYSEDLVKNATWNIVLFFHANWCPSCVSIDKNVSSSTIPSDLTLLKVDYDNSDDLKTKYGVLSQTTFVQVDNKWNMIKKWVSARDLDDIISKIK